MKFSFFLMLLIGLFAKPVHDIPIAIFNMKIDENNKVNMQVQFDKIDLENVVKNNYTAALSTNSVSKYLLDNTSWAINSKQLNWTICTSWEKGEHYFLEVEFLDTFDYLAKMTIQNHCLVEEVRNHSNVIYLDYQGRVRGFRLNKKRLQTTFEL